MMPKSAAMLISAMVRATTGDAGSRSIVLAIVGGTMLTVALTRPRLKWITQLTKGSQSARRWAERGLTAFAFVIGGYAWATLFLTLQHQLNAESAALLKGAGILLVAYAWLVHFEPFVSEWRLGGGVAALSLYTGFFILAAGAGVVSAEVIRTSSLTTGNIRLIFLVVSSAGVCWGLFKILPPLDRLTDRLLNLPHGDDGNGDSL